MRARAGEILKAQRRRRGLQLAEVALALDIPTLLIQALEKDDHTPFRSTLEARAYLRMYATHLEIDPEPFLLGTEHGQTVTVAHSYARPEEDREPERQDSSSSAHPLPVVQRPRRLVRRTLRLLIIAAALALAAAVLAPEVTSPAPTTPTVDATENPQQ